MILWSLFCNSCEKSLKIGSILSDMGKTPQNEIHSNYNISINNKPININNSLSKNFTNENNKKEDSLSSSDINNNNFLSQGVQGINSVANKNKFENMLNTYKEKSLSAYYIVNFSTISH